MHRIFGFWKGGICDQYEARPFLNRGQKLPSTENANIHLFIVVYDEENCWISGHIGYPALIVAGYPAKPFSGSPLIKRLRITGGQRTLTKENKVWIFLNKAIFHPTHLGTKTMKYLGSLQNARISTKSFTFLTLLRLQINTDGGKTALMFNTTLPTIGSAG